MFTYWFKVEEPLFFQKSSSMSHVFLGRPVSCCQGMYELTLSSCSVVVDGRLLRDVAGVDVDVPLDGVVIDISCFAVVTPAIEVADLDVVTVVDVAVDDVVGVVYMMGRVK